MKFVEKDRELNFEVESEYKCWIEDLVEIPGEVYGVIALRDKTSDFNIWIHNTPRCLCEMCGDIFEMTSGGYYPVCILDLQENKKKCFLVKKADIYDETIV